MKTLNKKNKKNRKSRKKRGGAASAPKYTPVVFNMKNNERLIQISKEIGDALMQSKLPDKNNFWIRKKVSHEIPPDCFGNPDTKNYLEVDKTLIDEVIVIVSNMFNDNSLFVKDNLVIDSETNIEAHFAKSKDKEVGSGLAMHEDNYGGIAHKLHTLIVYLDIDCKGGILKVENHEPIDPRSGNENETKIVMFDGGMLHCPSPMSEGERLIITYQFRQRDNTISKGGSGSKCVDINDVRRFDVEEIEKLKNKPTAKLSKENLSKGFA